MASNESLVARRQAAVARGVSMVHPVFIERAENAVLWDADGRRYVDFAGGIAVLNTGHRHRRVLEAVRAQLDKVTHTCFQITPYEPYVALCEKLNALAPGKGPNKTVLMSTGAEAVENAVKIARAATKRAAVIAFSGGFHGRTYMALALTGKIDPYKAGFGPYPAEVYHAPFPSPLHGISVEDSFRALESIFKCDVAPDSVAAIIVEPVQGEGGFYVAPKDFIVRLRELCDRHGIILIADEIQSGAGRTGKMFAMEHYGVAADLYTLAKSLGGGFPLAAVVGRAEVMDACGPGGLGGTYAGNPVACAAALGGAGGILGRADLRARRPDRRACRQGARCDGSAPSGSRGSTPARRDDRVRARRGRRSAPPGRGSHEKAHGARARARADPAVLRGLRQRRANSRPDHGRGRASSTRASRSSRRRRRRCSPTPTRPCRACALPASG